MDAEDDIDFAELMRQADRREERRERRYGKLVADKLPDWAPNALRRALIDSLGATAMARVADRLSFDEPIEPHPDCTDPFCVHCQPGAHHLNAMDTKRSRLVRLATYPDMRGAWDAVTRSKRNGRFSRLAGAQRMDTDGICSMLIEEINRAFNSFEYLRTRSPAQKKKGAEKIARLARELAEAIDADEDGRLLDGRFFGRYIGLRHITHRAELGEVPKAWMAVCPELSFQPPPGYLESDDGTIPAWDEWPAIEKFRWLCDEVRSTSVRQVLSSFADEVHSMAESTPVISRPNSGNPHVRYLSQELSRFMRGWFDSPLDDAVACFVSAALDLPEPLTRDDVRPRRKRSTGT